MPRVLKVPYLGTAEEDVLLSEWLCEEAQAFRKGDPLAAVETLKASFEVEADESGVLLRQLVPAGTRVPVHAVLGVLGAEGERVGDAEIAALLAAEAGGGASTDAEPAPRAVADQDSGGGGERPETAGAVAAAPAARRRARELGVDLAAVAGTGPGGMVRVEDVEDIEAAASGGAGLVDPEFLAFLRDEREAAAFGALSSAFKVALYRRHGARIGADVELGPGSVLRAERLVLGDGSRFGAGCRVDAVEFLAGRLAQFGERCTVRCRRVQLGDNAFFVSDVEIGGGGAMDPEAELSVGSHGFVGERAHLNPCRRLELGDEVVISRDAVLMTHSFGGSVLDGYPNRFAGIRIGDRCQVGIGAVLFPGVEMGQGSILLSNSSLVTSVPPGRMFGGVPAQDMKAARRELTDGEQAELARELVREFGRQLALRGFAVDVVDAADGAGRPAPDFDLVVTAAGGVHRLHFGPVRGPERPDLPREELWVCASIDADAWERLPAEVAAFDLSVPRTRGPAGPMADAFREFLRKRGVRLRPRAWTYPGGWL